MAERREEAEDEGKGAGGTINPGGDDGRRPRCSRCGSVIRNDERVSCRDCGLDRLASLNTAALVVANVPFPFIHHNLSQVILLPGPGRMDQLSRCIMTKFFYHLCFHSSYFSFRTLLLVWTACSHFIRSGRMHIVVAVRGIIHDIMMCNTGSRDQLIIDLPSMMTTTASVYHAGAHREFDTVDCCIISRVGRPLPRPPSKLLPPATFCSHLVRHRSSGGRTSPVTLSSAQRHRISSSTTTETSGGNSWLSVRP